ncbi:S8 family serine peptidase [bacterium]|nr:S8 family serine peptidase [bacterium]
MIQNIGANNLPQLNNVSNNYTAKAAPQEESTANPQVGSDSVSLGKSEDLGEFVQGQVIIKTKGSLFAANTDVVSKYGATVLDDLRSPGMRALDNSKMLQLQLPEGMTTEQALEQMRQDPSIEFAVPNTIYHPEDVQVGKTFTAEELKNAPNDPDFPKQWDLYNDGSNGGKVRADIHAPEAWQKTTGLPTGQGPLIAVIDTGVDITHPDLKANIYTNTGEIPGNGIDDDGNGFIDDYHGWNAHMQNGDVMDYQGHGSHVAGTIGAVGNNGVGISGINQSATILPVKIFSDDGGADAASIIRGINYATAMGARLTSNSWGGGPANQAVHQAFLDSSAPLHMMSAGNSGTNNDMIPHYPSDYEMPNNIAVAATDRNDQLAKFSCYGENNVDIAAPGKDILSTVPGGYAVYSGTSMATPHVTGAAGLLLAMDPTMSNDELKSRLMEGGDKLANLDGKVASGARLNIEGAMNYNYTGE